MIRAIETPDKPLQEYTAQEQRIIRSPSVEDYLRQIRRALALSVLMHRMPADDDFVIDDGLMEEAVTATSELCEDAWKAARELSDALPGPIHNLHLVSDEREDEKTSGGAR